MYFDYPTQMAMFSAFSINIPTAMVKVNKNIINNILYQFSYI